MFCYENILVIIEIPVFPILNAINHPGLQVHKQCSGYVVLIISLIEEDILSITSLQNSIKTKLKAMFPLNNMSWESQTNFWQ